ncbi:hypothetical protein, partial [Streptomyces sp. NPDC006996]|uniref:hypothetical protein n=1 Tax=Streptomyces sp. NPDC006996 TaxID=3156908 RepID=UPI00340EC275
LTELRVELPPLLRHDSQLPLQSRPLRYEGKVTSYCVPQDRALSVQPWHGQVTRQEISLGIPVAACKALTGAVVSAAADALVCGAEPFAFLVPVVRFRFETEEHDPI